MQSIVEPLLKVSIYMFFGATHCKNITLQHCIYRFLYKKNSNYFDANEHKQIVELELRKKSVYRLNFIFINSSGNMILL
jgi:hypothetical protein